MKPRHPRLPTLWLMTDERQGEGLWEALARLPRGSGVVFRHYGLEKVARRDLFERVRRIARRRRLMLVVAGEPQGLRGDGVHNRQKRRGLRTASAHSIPEMVAAERAGADLAFVSPVFATRSHPGAKPLGRVRFGLLTRSARAPVIALGGMTPRRARSLAAFGIYGWAAIDAWAVVRT